jgi:hypothetical protein
VAENHEEACQELQRLVNVVVDYTKTNGLALNGSKTQVMVGGKGKFDRSFTVPPYLHSLAWEARFRAGWVA